MHKFFSSLFVCPIMSAYIIKRFLIFFALTLTSITVLILMIDIVELARRASSFEGVSFGLILLMALYKSPQLMITLAPFVTLFSSLFVFTSLNNKQEIVIFRSAGFSAWQFGLPVFVVTLILGVCIIGVIHPISAKSTAAFDNLEEQYLTRSGNKLKLIDGVFWLRQRDYSGWVILKAKGIDDEMARKGKTVLLYPEAFLFNRENHLDMRIDASKASLEERSWLFENARIYKPEREVPLAMKNYINLPTSLTHKQLQDSFTAVETVSFWSLPYIISIVQKTGFDPIELQILFFSLLGLPLFLVSMSMIATATSLKPPRQGNTLMFVGLGVAIGFILFFLNYFVQALGISGQIVPLVAGFAPMFISLLIAISLILVFEES